MIIGRQVRCSFLLAFYLLVAACGGGGSGGNGMNGGNPRSTPIGPLSDSDNAPNSVSESAATGTTVGVTLDAMDADSGDTVTYSLVDSAGGLFAVGASTGTVTVAGQLDFEQIASHTIRGRARSSDGSQSEANFTIDLIDDTQEFSLRISFPVTHPSAVVHFSGSEIDIAGTVTGPPGDTLDVAVRIGGLSLPAVIDVDGNWRVTNAPIDPNGVGSVNLNVVATSQSGRLISIPIKISTETMFASPQSIAIDPTRRRAIVVDTTMTELVAIDLVTGQRDVLSGPSRGTGPHLGLFGRVAVNSATNTAYVWSGPSFLAVDLTTGNRTVLSNGSTGTGPVPQGGFGDVFVHSGTNRLFVTGLKEIIAIDLATGNRTSISGNGVGSGPAFGTPGGIVVLSNNRALVTDFGTSLISVNLSNGNRTIISSNASSNGPDFKGHMNLAADEQNNRALVVGRELSAHLIAVNLNNGNRTVISSDTVAGPDIFDPNGVVLDAQSNRALVVDDIGKRVTGINLTTGVRSILSDNSVAGGVTPFDSSKINLDFDGKRILFGDGNKPIVYSVDLQSGQKSILVDNSMGIGPSISSVMNAVYDQVNNRMIARTGIGLVGLDLVNGNRTLLSDPDTINGPPISSIADMTLDSPANRILAVERDDRFNPTLIEVDLATGLRRTLSGPANGTGPNLNRPAGVILDRTRNQVIVADIAALGLIAVDLSTSDRRFVSVSDPTNVFSPPAVALDEASRRIFALNQDFGGKELEEIDELTGSRTVVSSSVVGDGVAFDNFSHIAMDMANNRAFVLHNGGREILIVDLISGDRVLFAR